MSINVGNQLRRAREAKELDLREISEALFIRQTYLQALENGRPEIIPSPVQARGFLRMYAEYLELDSEALLREWEGSPAPTPEPAVRSVPREKAAPEPVCQPPVPPVAPVQQVPPQIPSEQPEPQKPRKNERKPLFAPKSSRKSEEVKKSEDPIRDIFIEIGKQLRERRQAINLTVEDCEAQTLIRSIYIEFMESGDFDQLPSFIQGRGMLSNYATFLALDTEKLMLMFADALQLLSQEKAREALAASSRNKEKPHKPVKKAGRLQQFFTPDLFIGIFVVLGMVFIIGYSILSITQYRESIQIALTTAVSEDSEHQEKPTQTPVIIETNTPTPLAMIINQNENEEEEEEFDPSRPVQLFVNASQRTYLKVLTDGKEAFTGRTLPGNSYPFDAENMIEVIVGNGDAVTFTHNRQNLGKLGRLGEVLDLQFYQSSVITPTPQFSPTPTLTPQPTYTPMQETPLPTNTPTPYIP